MRTIGELRQVNLGLSLVSVLVFVLHLPSMGLVPRGAVTAEATIRPAAAEVNATARCLGVNESWLSSACAQIERDEYRTSVSDRGLQAPNRAHNLRTYFRDGGIEVVPRAKEDAGTWSLTRRTTGWGRGQSQAAERWDETAAPSPSGARVTYE